MSGQPVTVISGLPAAAFLVPFLSGVLVFLVRRLPRPRIWSQAIAVAAAAVTVCVGLAMVSRVTGGAVLSAWGNELRVDALSALLVMVISGIVLMAAIYSIRYVAKPGLLIHATAGATAGAKAGAGSERRVSTFYALVLWFMATMIWGSVTNNILMLYVAVEATTLTTGLLVAFLWDRRALEAGYKYLMLLTIGITFALLGCVLMYAAGASTGQLAGREALLLSELGRVAHLMPPATALLIAAFLVIGFGTKAGIAPFHPWLPDAHAEAPTPVSVLLSGVMIKMAAYALARSVSIFFPTLPVLTIFLVALGTFTMLLGIVLALTQDDLKRLLAYSSVSQMGYVIAGLGLGTYLGCYGGLFHLLNHAIEKALLFMCVGAILYATGARKLSELGGLGKSMPITGACFFFGALAIAGFPPFNGFMSKLTIYLALAHEGLWWAAVLAVGASILTMVVLVRAGYTVFWARPNGGAAPGLAAAREVPAAMWVPMVILAGACLVFGIFPQMPYPLLDRAANALATLGR